MYFKNISALYEIKLVGDFLTFKANNSANPTEQSRSVGEESENQKSALRLTLL